MSGTSTARPEVAVVIPAYRAERFLGEAIESVLAQDEPPAEVVVVDDGSDDGTAAVAEGFGAPVRVVRHPENRGDAAARNTGVAAVTAPVITLHDADDRMLPHRLRLELDALLAGGDDVGCVLGRQTVFTDDGGPLPPWILDQEGNPIDRPASTVTTWRCTYDRVGPYDESFPRGSDTDWLVRMKATGLRVVLLDEVVMERRVHDSNISGAAKTPPRIEFVWSLRKVLDDRRSDS